MSYEMINNSYHICMMDYDLYVMDNVYTLYHI